MDGSHLTKEERLAKEKQFIDIFRITRNPSVASSVVYDTPNAVSLLNTKPRLKREVVRILNEIGLKEEYLGQKLKDVIDTADSPDAVLRGIEMGFKLHGSFAPQEVEVQADFDVWRHLSNDDIKRAIAEIAASLEGEKGSD